MDALTIGQLGQATGTKIETIRYYAFSPRYDVRRCLLCYSGRYPCFTQRLAKLAEPLFSR
jgi:hypothetical protein